MEKIQICTGGGKPIIGRIEYEEAVEKVNEIIPILDKLAIRVARLEVYYKQHRKEHLKNEKKSI